MDCHFLSQSMRFIHQRRHLCGGELRCVHLIRQRKHTTRHCCLDYIRPDSHLETNCFAHGIGPVGNSIGHIRLRSEKSVAESGRFVKMAASRADAIGGDDHARPNHNSFCDCIAQRNINTIVRAISARPDIPHSGKSGFHGGARGRNHAVGLGRGRDLQLSQTRCLIVRIIERDMRMRIHEPRR